MVCLSVCCRCCCHCHSFCLCESIVFASCTSSGMERSYCCGWSYVQEGINVYLILFCISTSLLAFCTYARFIRYGTFLCTKIHHQTFRSIKSKIFSSIPQPLSAGFSCKFFCKTYIHSCVPDKITRPKRLKNFEPFLLR